MPRFQFRIATAFFATIAVAILCVVGRWEGTVPYRTIPSAVFMIAACMSARHGKFPDLAWGCFTIAWLVALLQVDNDLINLLAVWSHPDLVQIQDDLVVSFGAAVALPSFLSLPAVALARKASHGSYSHGRKWVILCAIISLVNVTLVTIAALLYIRHLAGVAPW